MELTTILSSKSIRFFFGVFPSGNGYLPDVSHVFQERFGFLGVPRSLEEYNPSNGVKFLHGKFQNTVIDELEVFNDGVVVHTKSTTEFADLFIDRLIDVVQTELKFELKDIPHRQRMYISELEIKMEKNLDPMFGKLAEVYELINQSLASQADGIPPVKANGISISCDNFLSPHLKPSVFSLERRGGNSFDTNLYFTRAPLATATHIEVINQIERLI